MSELQRKYDGLKNAHKTLSVEVVALRTQVTTLGDELSYRTYRPWIKELADERDALKARVEDCEVYLRSIVILHLERKLGYRSDEETLSRLEDYASTIDKLIPIHKGSGG